MTRTPAARASKAASKPATLDLTQTVEISVIVRSRMPESKWLAGLNKLTAQNPTGRRYPSSAGVNRIHGTSAADIKAVARFAAQNHLQVTETNPGRRLVELKGSLGDIQQAFHIKFALQQEGGQIYRTHTGSIWLPGDLRRIVTAVFGLDTTAEFTRTASIHLKSKGVDPREIAKIYGYPTDVDGSGERVAIIELGGGLNLFDLDAYCAAMKIRRPHVSVVELGGQKNAPASKEVIQGFLKRMDGGTPKTSDKLALGTIEATMDVQLVAVLAPGADIVVYFAPPTVAGKYLAWSEAIHSTNYPASVISCSWSAHENTLLTSDIGAMEILYQRAARQGITVCCSAGDDGDNVHYPASSQWVLGCGGTHVRFDKHGFEETLWKESLFNFVCSSGGGESQLFKVPTWQKQYLRKRRIRMKGRNVPDVAAKADIRNGYRVIAGGQTFSMGGTSAATPVWASLAARINQKIPSRLGYITPLLYSPEFEDGTFSTMPPNKDMAHPPKTVQKGTGLGSPRGDALVAALLKNR